MRVRFIVTAAMLVVFAIPVQAEVVDQVLASVDTEVILLSDILMEIGPEIRDMREQAASAEEFGRQMEARIRETLEQAIDSRILLREALLAGMTIEDAAVDRRMQEFKDSYPSIDEYIKDLERVGMTQTELRDRFLKQQQSRSMAVHKMREFEEQVVISESEVAQYYYDNESEFVRPERVRCRQIFVPKTFDEQENAVKRARLDELIVELDTGEDFSELATRYSEGPGASDGGAMGWVVKSGPGYEGDLIPELEAAVFALEPGQFTDVVETEGGFHILKVEEKAPAGEASLEEVRKDIGPKLRTDAATEKFEKWLAEMRKRSRVQIFY